MENEYNNIDKSIIELKRKYSESELVSVLIKKVREKDIDIVKLKSEIDHLYELIITEINKEP